MSDLKTTVDFEKCYPLQFGQSEQEVAYALAQYLDTEMNMITQTMHTSDGYVVQCKGDANAEWTKYIGMDAAVTVQLRTQDGMLYAKVGTAKWIQKLGIAALGYVWFMPLALAAGIGAVRQAAIPTRIFDFIGSHLGVEGQTVVKEEPAGGKVCPSCGEPVGEGDVFCSHCGSKIEVVIPTCPTCGKQLSGTETFCPGCGTKLK